MRNQSTWATRGGASFAFFALIGLVFVSSVAWLSAADKAATAKPGSAVSEFPDDYFFYSSSNETQQKLNELVGKKMPELSVSDWINGEIKPEDMKGKVVVIDLWATWCGPCVAAIPHNNELMSKYKDRGLLVVGVCTSRSGQEKLGDSVKEHKIGYPVCKDPDLKTEKAYQISFYPTYVAVDRNGNIRAAGLRPDKVEEVVKKLLDEKAAS